MSNSSILKDASPEQLEAFVQIVVLVAYADGDLSATESQLLVEQVQQLADHRVNPEHLSDLMVELPPLSRSSNNWRATRIAMLKTALTREEFRVEAFRLAVKVAKSDSGIGLRESRMLINIMDELGIDHEFAKAQMSGDAE